MTGKEAWKLIHWIEEQAVDNPDMVRLEPRENFDQCIAGVVTRINLNVLCYDTHWIIMMLQNEMGMTADDAEEYYLYNIAGGNFMGEHSPVFLNAVTY